MSDTVARVAKAVLDVTAAAQEGAGLAAAWESAGLDPELMERFAATYAERDDAHPPAHRFQVALLVGMALARRA